MEEQPPQQPEKKALPPVDVTFPLDPRSRNLEFKRGEKLYLHLQCYAMAMMVTARYSSLPENYSPKDYRSFVSKKVILAGIAALALLYTIIFFFDTNAEFATLFALQWGIQQFEPLIKAVSIFCGAWINCGVNAVGIIEATQASADYVLTVTNKIQSDRAELLKYKDQSRPAKIWRGAKETGRLGLTLLIAGPPALAAGFMEDEEPPFTQAMTILTSIPSQYFACAGILSYSPSDVWNAVLSQIETNLRVLNNDLCSTNSDIKIRGNRTVRVLLELLPYITKGATEKNIRTGFITTFQNSGIDILFELLTMHGKVDGQYIFVLQEPMSTTGKVLAIGLGATCAAGSMGYSYESVKKIKNLFGALFLFGVSSFSNLRLGWQSGNGVVTYFYDWLIRGQKKISDLGPWFSERHTKLGWFFGNILSLSTIGFGLLSSTFAFSWGANYLANTVAAQAGFNALGLSNSTLAVAGETVAGILGVPAAGFVNLKLYLLFFLLYKTAVNLYINGGPRTQRNTQFVEQAENLVKALKDMPEENVHDMFIFWAAKHPELTKVAIALCIQAGFDNAKALGSGLLGNNPETRPEYKRDQKDVKFVWERDYREHKYSDKNPAAFYTQLPDISSIAPRETRPLVAAPVFGTGTNPGDIFNPALHYQ